MWLEGLWSLLVVVVVIGSLAWNGIPILIRSDGILMRLLVGRGRLQMTVWSLSVFPVPEGSGIGFEHGTSRIGIGSVGVGADDSRGWGEPGERVTFGDVVLVSEVSVPVSVSLNWCLFNVSALIRCPPLLLPYGKPPPVAVLLYTLIQHNTGQFFHVLQHKVLPLLLCFQRTVEEVTVPVLAGVESDPRKAPERMSEGTKVPLSTPPLRTPKVEAHGHPGTLQGFLVMRISAALTPRAQGAIPPEHFARLLPCHGDPSNFRKTN
mmetsp:Transcript_51404/g.100921  ORF Transcript_51404/g.100921 Transcript_51404/m.100921 type:complete len:264 (-) Transcript_51404:222-1013(-)